MFSPLSTRPSRALPGLLLSGRFRFDIFDKNDRLLERVDAPNGATTAGINDMLNNYFNAGAQNTTWFAGLIDNNTFSGLASSDTMAAHLGWSENTGYSGNRPQWIPGAPAGGSITNPAVFTFAITSAVSIKGAFLVSNSTKGGASGILWATGLLSVIQSLVSGQTLKLTYTCTGTPTN